MRAWLTCGVRLVAVIPLLCLTLSCGPVQAQERQHVVPLDQLSKDTARRGETRQANEAAIRQLLSSEQAQKALKSVNIDYARVDKAVAQLSDEDLARLAERSRQAQNNFSGGRMGNLSDRDLLIIIIVAVLVIALVAVLH